MMMDMHSVSALIVPIMNMGLQVLIILAWLILILMCIPALGELLSHYQPETLAKKPVKNTPIAKENTKEQSVKLLPSIKEDQ